MEIHRFLWDVESLPNGSNMAELATTKVEDVQNRYIADNVHGKMFETNPGFRKYVVFKLPGSKMAGTLDVGIL